MKKNPDGKPRENMEKIWKRILFIYFGKPLENIGVGTDRRGDAHPDREQSAIRLGSFPARAPVQRCRTLSLGNEKGDPLSGAAPRFHHRLENQMISYSVPSISTVTTLSRSMLFGMTCFPLSSPAASCFALGFFSGVKSLMSCNCFSSAALPFTR